MNICYDRVLSLVRDCKPLVLDPFAVQDVTEKGLSNYVTAVDYHVQSFLTRELHRLYPHIQMLGEEAENNTLDFTRPCWILDPIDGTANLMHGYRESAVSLALWDGKELTFGAVYNPFTEELFHAVKGRGAFLNDTPIHTSDRPDLLHGLMIVGTSPYEKSRSVEVFDMIRRVYEGSEDIRRGGSAALEICRVACGRADGYVEYNLKPWDYAGGMVILEEAGGTATDFAGNHPNATGRSDCAVSNGHFHDELLAVLQNFTAI